MIVQNARILTLAVESDVGPIIGCGLMFASDDEAMAFARAAQEYYESPAGVDKTFLFDITDHGSHCTVRTAIIVGNRFTSIDFEQADRRILTDLTTALDQQPYFFIVLCREEELGIYPYLTDEIEIYRSQLQVGGKTILGNPQAPWPKTLRFT